MFSGAFVMSSLSRMTVTATIETRIGRFARGLFTSDNERRIGKTNAVFHLRQLNTRERNDGKPGCGLRNTPAADLQGRFLGAHRIPVVLFPETKYDEQALQFETDDVLVFYSDGLVEARDETNEDFGLKRLAQAVKENSARSAG